MKKLVIAVALLLLTACSPSSSFVQGEVVSCESISQDPTFTGGIKMDCLDRSEGAQLGALRGPMVVNVWGSWCTSCLAEMPEFVSFYSKAKGKVQLVGVAVEEAALENSQKFIVKHGMTWPNFYDRENKTRGYFGMGVPVTWFIDAAGEVKYKKIGVIKSEAELVALSDKYLGVKI